MNVLMRGTRIDLRRPTQADAPSLYRYCRHPEMLRLTGTPFSPYRLEHAEKYVRTSRTRERKKIAFHRGVVENKSGDLVGMISLYLTAGEYRSAEVGCWSGKPYWGLGYMSEALQMMLRLGFRRLRLNRIHARVFPGNQRSCSLVERAGFHLEGRLRRCKKVRGRITDELVYSLLRDEYRAQR